MRLDHDDQMAAMGLPTRNPFAWRVSPPEQGPETPVERNARMSKERWRKKAKEVAAQKAALRTNPESSLGYSNQAAADRTLSIRGRG